MMLGLENFLLKKATGGITDELELAKQQRDYFKEELDKHKKKLKKFQADFLVEHIRFKEVT